MKVAAIQHDIVWEDPAANLALHTERIARAVAAGAELVVMSEMYSTGFSMDTARTAESPDGPSVGFLVDQAVDHKVWLCASMAVSVPGQPLPTNRLILAGPCGDLHHYDKIHPFTYGGEHEHFSPGDRFLTDSISVGGESLRVSAFVCYDLRFADEFWGLAPDTDLYLVPANWPAKRRGHWRALLVARAIENQAYVVGVNRVGEGGGLEYCGDSLIVDPLGEVISDGQGGQEQLLIADVDADMVNKVRTRFPFLQDRR